MQPVNRDGVAAWSLGEVVYVAYLMLLAVAWVVVPMVMVLAGRY
jgi:hypothetical protein